MIYDILSNNKKLSSEKFDFSNPPIDPIQLYVDLAETMIENKLLSLSANQIGINYRAFVITAENVIGCFNPIIIDQSDEQVVLEEICSSEKDYFIKIKRPKKIKVRYTQPNGEVVTSTFDGMTARIFQHEVDNLNDFNIKLRANRYHLDQANKRMKKRKLFKA